MRTIMMEIVIKLGLIPFFFFFWGNVQVKNSDKQTRSSSRPGSGADTWKEKKICFVTILIPPSTLSFHLPEGKRFFMYIFNGTLLCCDSCTQNKNINTMFSIVYAVGREGNTSYRWCPCLPSHELVCVFVCFVCIYILTHVGLCRPRDVYLYFLWPTSIRTQMIGGLWASSRSENRIEAIISLLFCSLAARFVVAISNLYYQCWVRISMSFCMVWLKSGASAIS